MMLGRASACSRFRPDLLDFVDHRARSPRTADALAHLDRCRACEAEIAGVALAVHGLRRLGSEVAAAEPGPDAWDRLADRIRRPAPAPWRWRLTLGGALGAALLVALVVGPATVRNEQVTEITWTLPPPVAMPASREELLVEQRYLDAIRVQRPSAAPVVRPDTGSVPRVYPDGYRPQEKEVDPEKASGRPLGAI